MPEYAWAAALIALPFLAWDEVYEMGLIVRNGAVSLWRAAVRRRNRG